MTEYSIVQAHVEDTEKHEIWWGYTDAGYVSLWVGQRDNAEYRIDMTAEQFKILTANALVVCELLKQNGHLK